MKPQRRSALGALLAGAVLSTLAMSARAADWPAQKPISYVVPFTVGGSTDVVGRVLAQKLGDRLHQNVIVENKPGAAGGIGATYVAKAPPDGYTLFGGTISTHAINASL
ncbi:MAG: Bug family tripartite tricarboxylate transporter substrate binding protein, partial [Achromobacter marplatensis]|uniref:Bug family tripartite tricarboxylate transporter substrate binding protein n=1 Tax=Achromobacter marplatensis TaxID=470868 RepID=UPI003D054087